MGILRFEFTGKHQLQSKEVLQFLLGDSMRQDIDVCIAWLVNLKFGEGTFTWKILADNLKKAASVRLPVGICKPKYAGTEATSNDLRLAMFYAQVTFVLLRGGKMATEKDVKAMLNPPNCSFMHQRTRPEINKHIECRHKHLQNLFNEILTKGSPRKCTPMNCAQMYELNLQKAAEHTEVRALNIFQQFMCFAFWSWKFFDFGCEPARETGCQWCAGGESSSDC